MPRDSERSIGSISAIYVDIEVGNGTFRRVCSGMSGNQGVSGVDRAGRLGHIAASRARWRKQHSAGVSGQPRVPA